ncbi:MAG: hypothetical protein AB7T10_03095 [bacterium]
MDRRVWLAVIFLIAVSIFCEDVDTVYTAPSLEFPQENSDTIANFENKEIDDTIIDTDQKIRNKQSTCLKYGAFYFIPTAAYIYSIYLNELPDEHNNNCVYCISYPIGLVTLEGFIANIILNKPFFSIENPKSFISLDGNVGIITPLTYIYDNGGPILNLDIKGFNRIALEYEYRFNKGFGIQICGERLGAMADFSDDYIYGFFGYSLGFRFTDWSININKILFGYSFKDNTSKDYGSDFWGFGIGWSNRYYPYKGLFIEPDVSYRFSRTADYSVSIIGLFGGVNLGYRF